jgi:hypothetical protein
MLPGSIPKPKGFRIARMPVKVTPAIWQNIDMASDSIFDASLIIASLDICYLKN